MYPQKLHLFIYIYIFIYIIKKLICIVLTKITPDNQHNNRSLNHYTISTIDHLTTNLFIAMNNAIGLIAHFPNKKIRRIMKC